MIAFVEGLFQPLPSRRYAHQGQLICSGGLKGLCLGVSTRVTEACLGSHLQGEREQQDLCTELCARLLQYSQLDNRGRTVELSVPLFSC